MNQIGRYKILKRLGGGGFGEVFLGEDPQIGRQVAIKVFKPKDENLIAFATSSDEEGLEILRARFLSEAKILASLDEEPNIVGVLEYGELDDGSPFYVMPYLPNSLSDELGKDVFDVSALEELPETQRPRALPLDRALEILEQILTGLAAAHAKGLIHRDIKPSNLMLSESGQLRIVDFGIAKAPDGQHSTVSRLGLGSRNYMAPEQRESAKHVDARADVYSAGVMAYRMLTGKLPIGRFADPNVAVPALGQAMNDLLLAMMDVDKDERPKDAAHALAAFQTARASVGQENGASDTGTWVGEGEAGIRDELKPLRAEIAGLVGQKGLLRKADRDALTAMAAIAELEDADLDRLVEDVIKGDKQLAAKRRLATAIQSRVKTVQGPLSDAVLKGFVNAASAVDWDENKIKELMQQAVAELQGDKSAKASTRTKRTGRGFSLPIKPIAISLVVIVVLSAGGYGVYEWRQGQIIAEQAERERAQAAAEAQSAWQAANDEDRIESYSSYLEQWPDALNADDARARIQELEAQGQGVVTQVQDYLNRLGYRVPQNGELGTRTTESIKTFEADQGIVVTGSADQVLLESLVAEYKRRDEQAWQRSEEEDTESAFETYRSEFPDGQYTDQVDERIAQVRDREAWASAVDENTEASFEQYAQDYPDGQYLDQVSGQIEAIRAEAELAASKAGARRQLITGIQTELKRLGRDVSVDGALGPGTSEQIRAFEKTTDRMETGEATDELLAHLKETEKWPVPEPGGTFSDCPNCMEMVVIPGGRFMMGLEDSESLQRDVALESFALARTEVTVGQFRRFVDATGYRTDAERNTGGMSGCAIYKDGNFNPVAGRDWRNPGFIQSDNHPVVCVSWNDARAYVEWFSKEAGEEYRLPSEAEQEYALRAGSRTSWPWGEFNSDITPDVCSYANVLDQTAKRGALSEFEHSVLPCADGHAFTAPVANYRPNAFGLHDMHGNTREWSGDCWNENYIGAPTDGSAWMSGNCDGAVVRGGSWLYGNALYLMSSMREPYERFVRTSGLGLRLARSL